MNRKYNPWVSLVALLLLAVILAYACTGCSAEATEVEDTADRFTVEKVGSGCRIITDNETGVQYLFYISGYGGLTKLEG